ncbi:MAG: hypothetical protein DRN78_00105 [Thermoproteota archaeon]|nr:MAG: hypothetical protein DRN78_00105 [Candidatus Korarchaeota archaeon]
MGARIRNLTPHTITVFLPSEGRIDLPSEGVARVSTHESLVGTLETPEGPVPLVRVEYGEVQGLPDPREVDYVIVSSLVAAALKQRPEWEGKILVPNTSPTPNGAVRDENGRIRGVKSLILY